VIDFARDFALLETEDRTSVVKTSQNESTEDQREDGMKLKPKIRSMKWGQEHTNRRKFYDQENS